MAETYSKLFSSILGSSIWGEDDQTRIVWITMLAMKDRDGYVGASVPGLARLANVPLEAVQRALATFLAPDKHSRSADFEGRRIEVADRGWIVLNHERFRDMRDEDARRAYERDRKRAQRAARNVPDSPAVSAHAESDADAESNHPPTHPSTSTSVPVPSAVPGGWVGGEPPVAMTQTKPQAPTPPVPDRASVPDRAASVPGTVLTIDERLAAAKMGSIEEAEAIADYLGWGLRASGRREMLQGLIAQGMGVHHMVELDRLAKKQGRAPAALAWSWLQSGAWVGIVTETGFPVVPQHLQERFDDDEESPPPPRALRALPPAVGAIYGENQKAPR